MTEVPTRLCGNKLMLKMLQLQQTIIINAEHKCSCAAHIFSFGYALFQRL